MDAEAEAPALRSARKGDLKPTLVLSEMAPRDAPDDEPAAAAPASHGFAPDLVPRRSALHDAPKRRDFGPLSVIAVLVIALGIGVAFGFAVDAESWSLPWRSAQEEVADAPRPGEPLGAGPGTAAAPAVLTAAPGPDIADGAAGADERPIPVPMLRPSGPGATGGAEILIEEIDGNRANGGPAGDAAPVSEAAAAGGPAVAGEEVAAAEVDGTDVDRLAPLFLGRIYVHYAEAPDDPGRRGRALDIARRLEESGYRVGGVRPVNFPVTGSSVRYFFESDAPVAARLQEDLPAGIADQTRLMDFTAYEPRPRPGTIELWVADPS